MKGKLLRRVVAVMLAMALSLQAFANVGVKAVEDVTIDASGFNVSGGSYSGTVVAKNNTSSKLFVAVKVNYVCKHSQNSSEVTGTVEVGTVMLNPNQTYTFNLNNTYFNWEAGTLKSATGDCMVITDNYDIAGTYTNLNSENGSGIQLIGVGYGYTPEGKCYYWVDLTNTDDNKTLSSIKVSGSFQGMSNPLTFSNCGLAPGETKRVRSAEFTGTNPGTMNDYKLSDPVLVSEEAPTLSGIQGPTISTTNVGNKAVVWSKVKFGKYKISSKTAEEDIEWKVLKVNGNNITIMTDQALVAVPYANSWGNTKWSNSFVRDYLEIVFKHDAFTNSERNQIIESSITTKPVAGSTVSDTDTSEDDIYILSLEELKEYGFYNGEGSTVPTRQIKMSKVLKEQLGADTNYASYFLRNQGYFKYDVVGVESTGKVCASGWRTYAQAAVCPVLQVPISAVTFSGSTYAKIKDGAENLPEVKITPVKGYDKQAVSGDSVQSGGVTYVVTKATDKNAELPYKTVGGAAGTFDNTVKVKTVKKGAKTVTIPDKITVGKQTFTVTGIDKKAFAKAKKSLKTIKIKAKNLDTVDKNAFSGLKSTTTVKAAKSAYNKVKKAVKKADSKVKVKKA